MLSKWQIWDFHKTVIHDLSAGFKIITAFDPWIEFLLSREINKKNEYRIIPAFDLTVEWLEDRLLGLSLFGSDESFIITQSESMPTPCKEFFKERQNELAEKELILFFNKDDTVIKSLEKNKSIMVYKIEAPKFWDINKLLDFMLGTAEVRLTQEAKALLLATVNHDCSHFSYYINLLKINYGSEKVTDQELKKYISSPRLDQFAVVTLFNNKKKAKFVDKVVSAKMNKKEAIPFFGFMLSHVIKLMDTTYLKNKNYKSKYDKEILATAGSWTKEELLRSLEYFNQCQILAKTDLAKLENFLKYDLEQNFYYTTVKSLDT